MQITTKDFLKVFDAWAEIMQENKNYLIQLDSIAGDGDLGLTMADGFAAIKKYAHETDVTDFGMLFFNVGKTMNSHASSSLGTLISFGFMEAAKAFKGKEYMTGCELGVFLDTFERGIVTRGKAKVGEKTFLDGFDPAVQALKKATREEDVREALREAAAAAHQGSANTVGMLACWGRAARRGEDSRQILDPGAVVAALIVDALAASFDI